jgi:hypothetical protein
MNDLSVSLYWADALGSLDGLSLAAFIIMAFVSFFTAFGVMMADMTDEYRVKGLKIVRGFVLSLPVLAVLIVVTPSRETVYAIAASEMTEQALKTPIASKAMQAVEKWIDRQLSEVPAK